MGPWRRALPALPDMAFKCIFPEGPGTLLLRNYLDLQNGQNYAPYTADSLYFEILAIILGSFGGPGRA